MSTPLIHHFNVILDYIRRDIPVGLKVLEHRVASSDFVVTLIASHFTSLASSSNQVMVRIVLCPFPTFDASLQLSNTLVNRTDLSD